MIWGRSRLYVNSSPVVTSEVSESEKIADIEPGTSAGDFWGISDKTMAIGGDVLEAIMIY